MKKLFTKIIFKIYFTITLLLSISPKILFAQAIETKSEANIGITKEMFSDVNIRDAKAIINLWTKMVHEKVAYNVKSSSFIYEDMQQLIKDINETKVDYIFLSTPQYLKYKSSLKLKPYYGTLINKQKSFDLYLMIRNNTNIKIFSDLKNSSIAVQGGRFKLIGKLFLDYLCLKNGVTEKEKFFKKIIYDDNASKTILSTFFGKTDACIVTNSTFEITSEMNPQINNTLRIFSEKENLVNDLFCFRNDIPKNEVARAIGFGDQIDSDPKSSQIYKIFKIDGSFLLSDSDLASTFEFWEGYNKLKKKN